MAFRDFEYPTVLRQFGVTSDTPFAKLFPDVPPLAVRPAVAAVLPMFHQIASFGTAKARAECMVMPLLVDLVDRYRCHVGLYSGAPLPDDPDYRLTGEYDFLLCGSPQSFAPTPPARAVVMMGRHECGTSDYGPCVAAMIAAQRYNRRRGSDAGPVYGCLTNGREWRFSVLDGSTLTADWNQYGLNDADRILGILAHILGPIPAAAAA